MGRDSKTHLKRLKLKSDARLKLLRRTLRERRVLAQYVHELKVPRLQSDPETYTKEYRDLVSSIVMCCPNLERLVGFYPTYDHEFDRLTHSLSTRTRLRQHTWIIGANEAITQRSHQQIFGLMDQMQRGMFLNFHSRWTSLETLFLHSQSSGILEGDMFTACLHSLPSLKNLCISGFDMDDFNDSTLQTLPSLESLRLQDLAGITCDGLTDFARNPAAHSIQRLSLVNLELSDLLTIASLMVKLEHLERFSLVQDCSPEPPAGELIFQPIIASSGLKHLHWDILRSGSANENLANSIMANGFPKLRTIKAPSDYNGKLQALCIPRESVAWRTDKFGKPRRPDSVANQNPTLGALEEARKLAQCRLEEAKQKVWFRIVVEDVDVGMITEVIDCNGFMGRTGINHKIAYNLDPHIQGCDDAMIDFPTLVNGNDEASIGEGDNLVSMREPKAGVNECAGMWNASHPDGNRWWRHQYRFRYRPIDLMDFF